MCVDGITLLTAQPAALSVGTSSGVCTFPGQACKVESEVADFDSVEEVMSSTIAERIVRLKDRAKMDQRKLRDETGISQPTLSRIISGKREPRMDEVILLAGALGVSPSEILEENPLEDRVLAAHRATDATVDTAHVRQKLLSFLQMDEYLELHGITA